MSCGPRPPPLPGRYFTEIVEIIRLRWIDARYVFHSGRHQTCFYRIKIRDQCVVVNVYTVFVWVCLSLCIFVSRWRTSGWGGVLKRHEMSEAIFWAGRPICQSFFYKLQTQVIYTEFQFQWMFSQITKGYWKVVKLKTQNKLILNTLTSLNLE